jgi:hypothetical protein
MKKINFLIVLIALLCGATSCSNKKKENTLQGQIDEFRSILTTSDTTQMLNLCDNAMELLKNKRIDEVLASLNLYNDSTKDITPITETISKRYARKFQMFPVLEYKRLYYSFMLEGCNDVKYEVTFATAEQAGTDKPATTMFMFNPVKVNGEWKLCVKTADDFIDRKSDYNSVFTK